MNYITFIGYSSEDNDIAEWIYDCLSRIVQIKPYKAEVYREYGTDFKQRIRDVLFESNFMVVLLGNNGKNSQWVNQEIGFAYALKTTRSQRYRELPYIIPISQKDVQLKGFITKHDIDIIFMDDFSSYSMVMSQIIFTMRSNIVNGLEDKVLNLYVTCSCLDEKGLPFIYQASIPSNETICRVVESVTVESGQEPILEYTCPKCNSKNCVDARTFLPVKTENSPPPL
jgi:hypothetical protein